ncbi:MAG: hypothetical protein IT445_01260 [Phycisphaeraceae bacterium]|nr:hypothetical protein [Phycisphaeraceae bacterium]
MSRTIHQQLAELRQRLQEGQVEQVRQPLETLAADHADAAVLQMLGECYLALNLPQRAILPLAAATGLSDDTAPAALLARALLEVGRWDEALLAAQRILRRQPRNREALRIMQQLPRE